MLEVKVRKEVESRCGIKCSECENFPCDLLKSFAYDEKQGDNGKQIENCNMWCKK